MEHTSLQWHPAFVAAMNLELKANRADLDFQKEYNLNTKPLEIDLLVIRKHPQVRIENEILCGALQILLDNRRRDQSCHHENLSAFRGGGGQIPVNTAFSPAPTKKINIFCRRIL